MTFIKYILTASVISFIIAVYPVFLMTPENMVPFITGYVIALVNVILGYALIELSIEKNMRSFMVLVFGGMFARMLLVMGTIIILFYTTSMNIITLILSVMFFYFLFAAIEIFYLNKRKPNNQTAGSGKLKSI